ncbi:MAG TPA: hypothetical protein DC013_10785 [Ruminococcaceae bacterium]|nr:hypothetical protein [Oscillospiraceae bacterium]
MIDKEQRRFLEFSNGARHSPYAVGFAERMLRRNVPDSILLANLKNRIGLRLKSAALAFFKL